MSDPAEPAAEPGPEPERPGTERAGEPERLGPLALQRYRKLSMHDTRLLRISNWLVEYPFANRLFPESLDAIEHCKRWGTVAILSDGDAVFQPRKG